MKSTEATLIPVPMYIFWQSVLAEVNRKLVSNYKYQGYIAEVFKGQKRNKEIEEIIDECIEKVNLDFEKRGVRSKYPVTPRMV